jgi:hypothetical protein
MEQYLQGEQQRQTVEASKNALIEALSSRYEKPYLPARRAL